MLTAFREELLEAGYDSIAEMTRFHLHLDDRTLIEFIDEFKEIVRRYADTEQTDGESPGYGGMFILHRLAEDRPQ
jgi:hypothetical protein